MSVLKFEIQFDNPACIYYAGQQVTGRVTLITTKEKKIRGISLRVKGEAEVKWTESRQVTRDGKSETEYDHYHASELYAEMEMWLVGASHPIYIVYKNSPVGKIAITDALEAEFSMAQFGQRLQGFMEIVVACVFLNGDMMLPPGEHIYLFSYTLPHNIPSSFEGSYGHVRYTVKAKVDRPWRFDHDCKVAFTVLTPLDLNLEPNMQEPVQNTKEKYLCCCCCRSGPITLVANVLRGFVPGQKIEAIIECDNVTSEEVSVNCYLEKVHKN